MPRPSGLGWLDRWLRHPLNRAFLAATLLLPTFLLLNTPLLPDARHGRQPISPEEIDRQRAGESSFREEHEPPPLEINSQEQRRRQQSLALAHHPPLPPLPPPPPPTPPPFQRVFAPGSLPFLLPRCDDTNVQCSAWAGMGECDRNPAYMFYHCMRACIVCNVSYAASLPDRVEIAPGVSMPTIGFGTAGLGDGTAEAVRSALAAGYRLLDSAQAREWYREDLVGRGLAESGVPRSEIFLTSKLHPQNLGYWNTLYTVRQSLVDLRTDYLDLFLLHYPDCNSNLCHGFVPEGDWKDSWAALEELVEEGSLRAIGVANFDVGQLEELVNVARIRPGLVQTQSEPRDQSRSVRAWCRRAGIRHQAYSTLGTQHNARALLEHPVVRGVAAAHAAARATPAQVLLSWALRHGSAVVPRSASPAHQRENLAARSLVLTPAEMQDLDGLEEG